MKRFKHGIRIQWNTRIWLWWTWRGRKRQHWTKQKVDSSSSLRLDPLIILLCRLTIYTGVQSAGFKDFLLKGELQRAIVDCGFEHPSEIQQECIPNAMIGVDILSQAKSGMGKTAVFVLTILH